MPHLQSDEVLAATLNQMVRLGIRLSGTFSGTARLVLPADSSSQRVSVLTGERVGCA